MNQDYEILGLEPGASQEEIKKAYFKLVRKHSPESDPGQFQIIRKAYEHLKQLQDGPQGPAFAAMREQAAIQMMDQIEQYRKERNDKRLLNACQEAWDSFPNHIQFLYMLVIAQRHCGKTGKAVKNAELLVRTDPDNKWFQQELAIAYAERGFTKKALPAFQKAYRLGCRDIRFILTYASLCDDFRRYDEGIEVLSEAISRDARWEKEDIPRLAEAFNGLLFMGQAANTSCLPNILRLIRQKVMQYQIYLKEYLPPLAAAIAQTCAKPHQSDEEIQEIDRLFNTIKSSCSLAQDLGQIQSSYEFYQINRLAGDSRIGNAIIRYLEAIHELNDKDPSFQKFAITDTELCMLQEREDTLKQAKIIKQEYPYIYQYIESFMKKLESSSPAYLKDSLMKTYLRLEPMFYGGYYFDTYPHERTAVFGTVINKGSEEAPYVRKSKKIGRNDPCPCGSGKKYKHCCMNK